MILGIDAALTHTGYGLVTKQKGILSFVACGTIVTNTKQNLPARLAAIYQGLEEVIRIHCPLTLVLEEGFSGKNASIALTLGQVRGIVWLLAGQTGLEIKAFSPRFIKQAIAGSGAATKDQVKLMVQKLLPTAKITTDHEADALAAAIAVATINPKLLP